ncbi:coiled-coil domain-containing protein [Peredibacter starrii]|uniref:Uncharacterized protein n=1 Tax=Peredibacter starrii TaxID=28202 RepID=A0AAX4HS54_9BACT|nr:hypothetical protein [Peredibacter starrii]WPU66223.1 hypothetical protein SOO65_05640 [Peredibacter starrii]
MTYYFISGAPEKLREFLNRFPMLSDAVEVKTNEQILSEEGSKDIFYFVDLHSLPVVKQALVFYIREKIPAAKLIYVTGDENASDLKNHQKSPIGGDAYVPFEINASELNAIVESLALKPPALPKVAPVKLSRLDMKTQFDDLEKLDAMKGHPVSVQVDDVFKSIIKTAAKKPLWQSAEALIKPVENNDSGEEPMSTKDQELSFDDGELEISIGDEEISSAPADDGLDLSLAEEDSLSLSDGSDDLNLAESSDQEQFGDLSLDTEEGEELSLGEEEEGEELSLGDDEGEELSLGDEEPLENIGELSFDEEIPALGELSLAEEPAADDLSLSGDVGLDLGDDDLSLNLGDEDASLDLSGNDEPSLSLDDGEMSDDAMAKLKEIDAIMDYDASQVAIRANPLQELESSIDEPLVSDDINLDNINFSSDEVGLEPEEEEIEEKPKKKKREPAPREARDLGQDLKEISGAYSGEMERMQATISNLRSDREELLAKIQKLEEDKVLQSRQSLSLRAELDEKKIELTIIRKKLNEEINELKDRLKLFDEKRLIIEEKNRILAQELDKAAQKNKIDVKKVQMRERELEQRLELLKADAETQIRHRDLKILELKRKIDAMEFDMESISTQEKRSVESRFELEDKLEKAIKTLRNAITVLEDETDRTNALDALKKNIDM